MRALLRTLGSPDAPDGLDQWQPADGRDFQILVEAEIGPADAEGSELFSILVVGVDWFAAHQPGKGFRWGRGSLILDEWNPEVLRRAVADLCTGAEADSWAELAERLMRFASWEFEDYRPETHHMAPLQHK